MPSRTACDLLTDTVVRLVDHADNIVAIKDATGNLVRASELVARLGDRISILTGDVLEGSMPKAKLRDVQAWLAANREHVAYVWQEVRALRYTGGRIDQ